MASQIDPAADELWQSVGSSTTVAGTENRQPRSDEQWARVRLSALVLIEATNLLVMDGRQLATPGNAQDHPNDPELLSPGEAQAQFASNRAAFRQMARALQAAGVQTLAAIDARDPAAVMEAGENLDEVCEACHRVFWYPKRASSTKG